jgi:hypothetical protein
MTSPATSKLKVNPPVGQLPVLQYCAPDQLQIDESYQRSLLGDFYSLEYVKLWGRALDEAFPALHVFGFTARLPGTEMGDALWALAEEKWDRFAIRFSGLDSPVKASVLDGHDGFEAAILCPAQTGGTDCCGTCSLCWATKRSIGFRRH